MPSTVGDRSTALGRASLALGAGLTANAVLGPLQLHVYAPLRRPVAAPLPGLPRQRGTAVGGDPRITWRA